MMISIDAEKTSDKIKHHFMIKMDILNGYKIYAFSNM